MKSLLIALIMGLSVGSALDAMRMPRRSPHMERVQGNARNAQKEAFDADKLDKAEQSAQLLKQRFDRGEAISLEELRDSIRTFYPATGLSELAKNMHDILYQLLHVLTCDKEVIAYMRDNQKMAVDLRERLVSLHVVMAKYTRLLNFPPVGIAVSREDAPEPLMQHIIDICKGAIVSCSDSLKGEIQKLLEEFRTKGGCNWIMSHYDAYLRLVQLRAEFERAKSEKRTADTMRFGLQIKEVQKRVDEMKKAVQGRRAFNRLHVTLSDFHHKTRFLRCNRGCQEVDSRLGRLENSQILAIFSLEEESPFKEMVFRSLDQFNEEQKTQLCATILAYCSKVHHPIPSQATIAKGAKFEIIAAYYFHSLRMLASWGEHLCLMNNDFFTRETDIILDDGRILECKNVQWEKLDEKGFKKIEQQIIDQKKLARSKGKGYRVALLSCNAIDPNNERCARFLTFLEDERVQVIDPNNPEICKALFDGQLARA